MSDIKENDDYLTKWNQKKLNAIKEVIQCIDSGKQDLNNGMEEIDFIVNEWNYGNNLDLSEEDVKTIVETIENPPEPNEKLKEAFKTYNERSIEWLENKWNNYDLNTGKSGFRLYLKQVLSKQKKTYTEEDVIFMVTRTMEYYMFVTRVPIQINLINGFLKDNYGFFKDEE